VAVMPSGRPAHLVELVRTEEGALEVCVPGRPPGFPELEASEQGALRERGFVSKEPADQAEAWVHPAEDAASATRLLQEILTEVFGEKPDVALDVGHGSHKIEHEARKNLATARARIETIVADISEKPPQQDEDGDYVLPIDEVHVMVSPRMAPDGQIVIRVFAITNVGVAVTPELGLFLARLNFGLMFGRFALDAEHGSIWFDENILGEEFREKELRFAIRMVASTADEWDDRLKQMFAGATYQEVLAGRAEEKPPSTKPGGVGQYL
jgi:hypothetical protein